ARLRDHLTRRESKIALLFVSRRVRPSSASKLLAKHLQPLLVRLGIPRGGFHSMRHGAASALAVLTPSSRARKSELVAPLPEFWGASAVQKFEAPLSLVAND